MSGAGRAARQRRALNLVWTAAGEYGFLPTFLAYRADGEPDRYLNAIIGLAHKFYAGEALRSFQRELDQSLLREMFTDIFWLGLEQAVFARESAARPVLAALRQEHARGFFEDDTDVAMQRLMMRNEIVHTLRAARCHEALGEPLGLRNPWDRRLYEALDYPGDLTAEEIVARTRQVFKRFFVFRFTDLAHGRRWHMVFGTRLMAWLRRILPMQRRYAASLAELSRPVWEEAADREEIGKDGLQLGNPRQSLANIRALFGPPLLTEAERVALEEAVCTGGHELAHLYFASGGAVAEEAENRALLTAQGVRARTELRLLVEQLSNAVAVCRQPLPIRSRTGRFQARQAWRAEWLQDGRVFELSQNEPQAGFEVTVLLDGSESRQGQQGLLAVQGYIIASALRQAGIPVRVLSFASVQDYTVLSELMPLQTGGAAAQAGGPEGVLGYAARGWNRDGLAFRALSAWLKRQTVKRTLLLVLTDARPSDALGLARPYLGAQHAYMGKAATEDTAQAVRELRAQGVKVIALIESVASKARALEAARAIYGQGFIYLTGLDGLAGAVSRLVLAELSR